MHARLIDKRLQWDRSFSDQARRAWAGGNGGSALNTLSDVLGQSLAVSAVFNIARFPRVGQESTFHEHSRNSSFPQNIIAASPDTAVRARRVAGQMIMDGGSKGETITAVEVCFDSVRAAARGRVEVNTNENGVGIRICDCYALGQRHEDVAIACHDDAITGFLKERTQTKRDVESHRLFRYPLAGNAAAVETAMTGVDYHNGRVPNCARRAFAC